MNKSKIRKFLSKNFELVTTNNIQTLILVIILIITINYGVGFKDLLDHEILLTAALFMISSIIAKIISHIIKKRIEDRNKLIDEYVKVSKCYIRNNEKMIHFDSNVVYANGYEDGIIDDRITQKQSDNYNIVPVTSLCFRKIKDKPFNFKYKLSKKSEYQLPERLLDYTGELRKAHEKSNIATNNTTIRLDKLDTKANTVTINYSYTTYLDTLFTNRAMDYKLSNGLTVREMFEPGPFMKSLEESDLSNHIGFNGFIELSDGKIVFVQRKDDLSSNKNKWQPSISGSLKAARCLNNDKLLTNEGISNAIRGEIIDELKIKDSKLIDNIDFSKDIFAYYRDMLEGGKPHFLFYHKFDGINSSKLENIFSGRDADEKKDDKKDAITDAASFKYFTTDELKNAKIDDKGTLIINREKLETSSSDELKNAKIDNKGTLTINREKLETSSSYIGPIKLFLLALSQDTIIK